MFMSRTSGAGLTCRGMDRIVRLKDCPSAICSPADAVRSRSRLRRANYYVNVIDAVSGYPLRSRFGDRNVGRPPTPRGRIAVSGALSSTADAWHLGASRHARRGEHQRRADKACSGISALCSELGLAPPGSLLATTSGPRRRPDAWCPAQGLPPPAPADCIGAKLARCVHGSCRTGPFDANDAVDRQCPGSSGTRLRRSRPAFLAQTLPVRAPMAGSRVNLCSRLTLADCRRGSGSRPRGLLTASS
jgi:hypothetical protein